MSSPADASAEILKAAFERFFLASTPVQRLVMRIRDISQWKDPLESIACLTTYSILLYYNLIVSAVVSCRPFNESDCSQYCERARLTFS